MHNNGIFYALICINNHIIFFIICMLSIASRTLSREPYKYVFLCTLDDTFIYSWCLNVLNIPFNVFHYIRCFDQIF